jgi:hypothetical protein
LREEVCCRGLQRIASAEITTRKESRSIATSPGSAEQVWFPLAEQVALLLRQTEGRKDELVALVTRQRKIDVILVGV